MTINGSVNGLNRDVLSALNNVRDKNQITPTEALQIKNAILKDRNIDANELDLINELTSNQNTVSVRNVASSAGAANVFNFRPAQGESRNILNEIKQVNGNFRNIDENSNPMSTLDKVALAADITGIVDPTPVSDGVSGLINLGQGNFVSAGLSVVSMVPYLGDAVGKPGKIMAKVLDQFPSLGRFVKSVDDVPLLISTMQKCKSVSKLPEALNALNNLHKGAEAAYKNTRFLSKAENLKLPTNGPVPFVPPARWDVTRPAKGPNGGFMDNFGNEWVKGPTRTVGDSHEWDVIPKNVNSGLANFSRDGSHVNVSLQGVITHR